MSTKNTVILDGVEYIYGSNRGMAAAFENASAAAQVTGYLSDRALLQRADIAYDHNVKRFVKHRYADPSLMNTLLMWQRRGVNLKKMIEEIEEYV